jgi:hypothetical protein
LVVVNADGTVSVVAETSVPASSGTPVVYENASTRDISAVYDSNAQKVVIAYTDYANNERGTAIVGTVSGSSISFGTAVIFNNGVTSSCTAVYHSSAQKVVIAYRDESYGDRGMGIVGTVSGTSISFGSEAYFEFGDTRHISAAYDANVQKTLIAYQDYDNSSYGTARVADVSGTSISYDGLLVFNSNSTTYTSTVYDANAQKSAIAYRDGSSYGKVVIATISGTGDISYGSTVVFNSGHTIYISAAFDSNSNKVVIAYRDGGNSNYGTAVVGTISGTSISFGTPVVFFTDSTSFISATYDTDAQKVIIVFYNGTITDKGYVISGSVSGTSISFDSSTSFTNAYVDHLSPTYDTNAKKTVIGYQDGNDGSKGKAVVYSPPSSSTNVTSENYIGISDGAYSDTSTATVQIVGSVDDAQSGLTAGQSYYVQTDGTLGTTPADPSVFAGTAVSATKLIVKG